MALATIISSVAGMAALQKEIRAMEEAHGELDNFIMDAKNDLALLEMAQNELVDISADVYDQSSVLKDLLLWATEAEKQGRFSSENLVEADGCEKILAITSYALIAPLDAARKV
jgi:hypothetical protein